MLVRAPNGTHEFIDFRETAPAAAFEDMYKDNNDASIFGGLARYVCAPLHLNRKSVLISSIVAFRENFVALNISTKAMAFSPGVQLWSPRSARPDTVGP